LSFSALQRAENSSIWRARSHHQAPECVSVLFSEPKIPQFCEQCEKRKHSGDVSVLFSEPKIPQSVCDSNRLIRAKSFSALQRAENSSIFVILFRIVRMLLKFQCSSASRKFLNSKLQAFHRLRAKFQCSSASRKFLNSMTIPCLIYACVGFSALQRAENSSILSV